MKKRKAARTDGQSAKRPHSNSAEIQRKIISQALARVGAQGNKHRNARYVLMWRGVAV